MTHSHDARQAAGAAALDIAVIGVGARVPGARGPDALWSLLMSGEDGLTTFTPEQLAAELEALGEVDRARYVPRRGVIDGIEAFDAPLFKLSAAEADLLDPQHRVLMEVVWEALEDAQASDCAGASLGLFTTSGLSQYLIRHLLPDPALRERHGELQLLMLNDKDFLATRLAYFLDVHGPAVNLQTGCSSGLVALHYACLSLQRGDCAAAVVGGVSIALPQQSGYVYSENMIGSRDGVCRAFDRDASGTVRGNGACAVVLKPLAAALADGDPVRAVIKGSALNNDGRDKVGFTAPSPRWQAEVIARAYRDCGVALDDIDLVEAHGTGTPLGDPIEARALNQVFGGAGTGRTRYLGALKTQIGHLDTTAGLAGLVKLCLALDHDTIPPTAHFRELNPRIGFGDAPFTINREPVAWPRRERPRCAALSSFGIGGTNAHVVVAEAPNCEPQACDGPQAIVVSARSAASLAALRDAYVQALEAMNEADAAGFAAFAAATRVGRRAFEHRLAISASGPAEAVARLRAAPARAAAPLAAGVRIAAEQMAAVAQRLGVTQHADRPDALAARLAALGIRHDQSAPLRLDVSQGAWRLEWADGASLTSDEPLSTPAGLDLQILLWRAGIALDFRLSAGRRGRPPVAVPTYRFERQRHWIEAARAGEAGAAAPPAAGAPPATLVALEALLLAQWRGLLGQPALRGIDNVFEQGANSLTVAQCVAQLTSTHALPMQVVDCYDAPSVAGQARMLGERLGLAAGLAQAPAAPLPAAEVEQFNNL
ncbi:polyketide synthase [Burkholderia glumae]|uniref:beta-ketoacyl [acyl carrier protein] synthase domain-containing protein n=1 Tax=Burkholderia glumae TaxID=337 RepID=UPI002036E809|nr:beta-ketoacyl synthase N-terminal-like domain-containing protein [Burkholderia glumae]MCM2547865.1 polyketide synthase [Burkholderia glumae]